MRTKGRKATGEGGSILIILMIGVAISSIALAVATQSWSSTWRRDREEELIFRGEQYVDAILAYRKEHGGQFPTNLEDLFKPGPRRLRYIRKLFRDPISPDGRWGLLYLMPGGRSVYDPAAAQRGGGAPPGLGGSGRGWGQSGVSPINRDPTGTGVRSARGTVPGAPPTGSFPSLPAPLRPASTGSFDDDAISEPPLGWPIVGVISRASGRLADSTFRIYKGHESVNEWQFQVFDRGLQLQQPATATAQPGRTGPAFVGPGFGGSGSIGGISDGSPRVRPGDGRRGMFPRIPGAPKGRRRPPPRDPDPSGGDILPDK